jgi:hypothetical protein
MKSKPYRKEIQDPHWAGGKPQRPFSLDHLEKKSRHELPDVPFACFHVSAENTFDFSRQTFFTVKIHPLVQDGVQEVSMQLKWREHTLPAPFYIPHYLQSYYNLQSI